MSTSKSPAAAAPWRSDFLKHVDTMDSPIFVLSSLSQESSSNAQPQFSPRVRTVVFRGMWASLPVNPKNPAELNPDNAYDSDLPAITTDVRMEKVGEMFDTGADGQSSARGGPVEAVFWMPEASTQWRLRGRAYLVGPDIGSDAAAPVRTAIGKRMRPGDSQDGWSWSRELTAHFGNMSPLMRGSFRNPPPGTPVTESPGDGLALGQKVEDLEDKIARQNFRVVIIAPEEVDRVDLSDPEKGRRWNYKLGGSEDEGTWKVTELWP